MAEFEVVEYSILCSTHALYTFESCVTFSQEVEVIWKRQWSLITWIYAFTRYGSALLILLDLLVVYETQERSWTIMLSLGFILQLFQLLCFAGFSTLRVSALSDRKILITGLVFLLSFMPAVIDVVGFVAKFASDGVIGSVPDKILSRIVQLSPLISVVAITISDVLVLLTTWSKTAHLYRESQVLGIKAPLAALLYRDGTLYFVILLIANILQIGTRYAHVEIPIDVSIGPVGTLVPTNNVFTSIIVCRFILNLRQVQSDSCSFVSGDQSISFRFIGDMGGQLQLLGDEDEEVEDDIVEGPSHAVEETGVPVQVADKVEDGGVAGLNSATRMGSDTQV